MHCLKGIDSDTTPFLPLVSRKSVGVGLGGQLGPLLFGTWQVEAEEGDTGQEGFRCSQAALGSYQFKLSGVCYFCGSRPLATTQSSPSKTKDSLLALLKHSCFHCSLALLSTALTFTSALALACTLGFGSPVAAARISETHAV